MLDMSDRHTRAVKRQPDTVVTALPVVAVPAQGTRVRHQSGALFRVQGMCRNDCGEAQVLLKALDSQQGIDCQVVPNTAFFAGALGSQAHFSRLRTSDAADLRRHLAAEVVCDEDLELILRSYDEPWRFFHTREHIYSIFSTATVRGRKLTLEQALAVLFHDIVYVPGAPQGSNENQSALLALAHKHRVHSESVDWSIVARIIEETASHEASDALSAVVQDLDLAHLADDPLHFSATNELVWLENRHLLGSVDARKDFDTRRLRFLLALAARGPLFSEAFRDIEACARENLERLRQDWQQKYGE